jgi:CheY-like chemotaxis protein
MKNMGGSDSILILVVEDEADIRSVAVETLREHGYAVIEAANAGIATILLEQGLPIALLFTDIIMPGDLDGIALGAAAQRLRPGIKILYTTGYSGAGRVVNEALKENVLSKPYRPVQLLQRVEALLAGRRNPSSVTVD